MLQACHFSGCAAVTGADQLGEDIVTEFSAFGTEFVEIRNIGVNPIDINDAGGDGGSGSDLGYTFEAGKLGTIVVN